MKKNKMRFSILLIMAFAILTISSCNKDDDAKRANQLVHNGNTYELSSGWINVGGGYATICLYSKGLTLNSSWDFVGIGNVLWLRDIIPTSEDVAGTYKIDNASKPGSIEEVEFNINYSNAGEDESLLRWYEASEGEMIVKVNESTYTITFEGKGINGTVFSLYYKGVLTKRQQ